MRNWTRFLWVALLAMLLAGCAGSGGTRSSAGNAQAGIALPSFSSCSTVVAR